MIPALALLLLLGQSPPAPPPPAEPPDVPEVKEEVTAGGDSLNLLQVPPLDLGQVEVIKGAASALYGPAALGGVINLVSRRPAAPETIALVNVTTQAGLDATIFTAAAPSHGWAWTLLGGFHGARRQDLDGDGWADLPAFARGVVRPRVRYEPGTGTAIFVTGGLIAETR